MLFIAAGAVAAEPASQVSSRPAFPGAQGYGAFTPGGRGGRIIRVTTLDAAGPGSLAEALDAQGPRIVIFEVGGVIDVDGKRLKVTQPFVTVAGQTAPSPGITVIRGNFEIDTHDVIVQHMRFRPGEAGRAKKSGWEVHGLNMGSASNVIVDHCSCSWGTDENLSIAGPRFNGGDTVEQWRQNTSHNVTVSNCIIAEALAVSTHAKGRHSMGTLIHDNATNIAIIGNLYACNNQRNPFAKGGVRAVIVNNWISNPGKRAIHYALLQSEWGPRKPINGQLTVVGNVLEYGPDTLPHTPLVQNGGGFLELFMEDNLAIDRDGNAAPLFAGRCTWLDKRPLWPDGLTPLPAGKVKQHVASNSGARPWDRDAIDKRIVQAALDGKGKIIDSEQETGGYPTMPATRAPFKPDDWNLDTLQPQ
jgi:hypothetical protein